MDGLKNVMGCLQADVKVTPVTGIFFSNTDLISAIWLCSFPKAHKTNIERGQKM